ncbi:MAG: response regulator [Chrysiogenetes bacterium]|nr:response regulator [Chrysiogenetes bacterium]
MSKGRIAILDDEPAVREILGEFLRTRGYEVSLFEEPNGLDKHLRNHPVDLLVCDLYLGDVTGLDVIRKLRPGYPALDIIVLTGFASIDNVIEAFRLGANEYLQKPVNLLLFENSIERLLEKKRLAREVLELKDIITIHQAAADIADHHALPNLYEIVLKTALKGASADAGAIVCFAGEGDELCVEFGAEHGLAAEERDQFLNLTPEQVRQLRHEYSAINGHCTELENNTCPVASVFGDDLGICVPMRQKGEVRGALHLVRRKSDTEFTEHEIASARVLAHNAAIAAERARLYKDLEVGYVASIESLAKALEAKDPYTGGHADRVRKYCRMMSDLTDLDEETKLRVESAALLHDIGKLGVSDYVLQKKGPLTADERDQIMEHPSIGDRILSEVPSLAAERLWVYEHHERWDGSGYPRGIGGEEISLPGRILILVEVYDALATKRSYKDAWPAEMIHEHFSEGSGKIYDPVTTELFLELFHKKLAQSKAS